MEQRYPLSGFAKYLLTKSYISADQLEEAWRRGGKLNEVLVTQGYLSSSLLTEALSEFYGVKREFLTQVNIDPVAIKTVPEDLARRYTLFPISVDTGVLTVALADPADLRVLDDIRILTGYEVQFHVADIKEIRAAISKYLTVEQSAASLSSVMEAKEEKGIWLLDGDLEITHDDGPIIRLVDSLMQQAIEQGASDIHWEPRETEFLVRYRIDGRLETKVSLPETAARLVVSRLKALAGMDIAERRLAQDGRITAGSDGKRIDLRVSSLPTVQGEKLVTRILNPDMALLPLEALGMRLSVEQEIRELLTRPHGLILVVGPTGSGKTTTLYALLSELKTDSINIVSIEDPVEYQLTGINQVPVKGSIGLNFAHGLRAILRQDPDVIMIGEIRDEETAKIAISAALTGHLVFSTLHTNTAAEAFGRLLEMGIEPYLLAASINGVLSQRLVRVLCNHCKTPTVLRQLDEYLFSLPEGQSQYKASNCKHCRETGYSGRIGIHELLLCTPEIKELILARRSSLEIEKEAIKQGMITLVQDGFIKVSNGVTSIEEVLRAAKG